MPTKDQKQTRSLSFKTDMPLWLLALLALLSAIRPVIHDLRALPFDSVMYLALAVAPLIVYLGIAVFRDNKRPIYDFVVMGIMFGIMLAFTHQIFWDSAFGSNPPQLGDNLAGKLAPEAEEVLFRSAAFTSSLTTGTMIGLIFGTIALIASNVKNRMQKSDKTDV